MQTKPFLKMEVLSVNFEKLISINQKSGDFYNIGMLCLDFYYILSKTHYYSLNSHNYSLIFLFFIGYYLCPIVPYVLFIAIHSIILFNANRRGLTD